MKNNIVVSVLVLNWNGKNFLKKLFDSLERQDLNKDIYEIIMADNGSTDDSVEYVRAHYPTIKIVLNKKNYGYAQGNNLGMKACQGKYILILNTDTKAEPSMLRILLDTIEKEDHIGAVVPIMYYMNEKNMICNAGSQLTNEDWPVRELGANELDASEFHSEKYISAFCGGAVMLRRKMLDDVGIFDGDFFLYFEDSDLSWRGQKKGWKYKINPKATVYHVSKGSSGGEDSRTFQYFVPRNRLLILFKNGSIKNIFRATAKTVLYNIVYPFGRAVFNKDRDTNIQRFSIGIKAIVMAYIYAPKMFLKRLGIIKERVI